MSSSVSVYRINRCIHPYMKVSTIMAMTIPAEILDNYAAAAEAANKAADEYKSLTSDNDKRIIDFLNTSEDEQIAAWRAQRDKITAQIEAAQKKLDEQEEKAREYASGKVAAVEGDPAEVKAAYVESRKAANDIRKALVLLVGEDAVNAAVEERGITEVISLRGTTTKGAQTGIRRPRISAATVNGEEVKNGKGKTSFTILEQYITKHFGKVTGDDLRAAAFTAAGTDDLNSLDEGTVVEFGFTVPGIGDGPSKDIRVSVTR